MQTHSFAICLPGEALGAAKASSVSSAQDHDVSFAEPRIQCRLPL